MRYKTANQHNKLTCKVEKDRKLNRVESTSSQYLQ